MPTATVSLTDRSPADLAVDALVIGVEPASQGTGGAATPTLADGVDLPRAARQHLESALGALRVRGKAEEVTVLTGVPKSGATTVLLVGLGPARPGTAGGPAERVRRAAGAAARALTGRASAAFALGATTAEEVGAVAEGITYGSYAFTTFHGVAKQGDQVRNGPLASAEIVVPKARDRALTSAVARATAIAGAVTYARDLVNTPPNVLFPESFCESVQARTKGTKTSLTVWDVDTLRKEGCGGLIGVGQGSAHGPRLGVLSYSPRRPKARIALVGKGITFDSGGLCLKPGASMVTMKCDMAGAAAVAAAVLAIAELGLPVEVTGYLCLAENMTGSDAQRPGDVVTMRGGKTVEIINTDAEGRLVMADGLVLASEKTPDLVIDVATLTGAQVVALGDRTAGVMGNDDALNALVQQLAGAVGESTWAMPLPEEIRATLDTPVADIKHTGERSAGMMTAATFLREFVGDDADGAQIPWVHIDIAGPAFNTGAPFGYTPKGATGASVRLLTAVAEHYAASA